MTTKLSITSYQEIADTLGRSSFGMHYDSSDSLRQVASESSFRDVRKELMTKFGDIELEINPGAVWFDQVKILDKEWITQHKEYCQAKAEFCEKYGCD